MQCKLTNSSDPISMPMRRLARLGVALGAGIAFCLTFAGQASASIPGYERVTAVSANNSDVEKSVTLYCPSGKELLGMGSQIWPISGTAYQHVVLDALRPGIWLTNMVVTAHEDLVGTSENWYIQAWAICAYPNAGFQTVYASSAINSTAYKSAFAYCPEGKVVLGAGGDLDNDYGRVVMEEISTESELDYVKVGARAEPGYGLGWGVAAYAICGPQLAGLARYISTSATNSNNKIVSASCPAGKVLLGSGGWAYALGTVNFMTIGPPNSTDHSNYMIAVEIGGGTTNNWSATSMAICADL